MTGIYGINYSNNYSLTGNYGYGYSTGAVSSAQPEEKGMVVNPGKSDVEKPGRKSSPAECETCKNRKYQDGSNEMVSFKSASHISPQASSSRVRAHEQEHVTNAYNKAAQNNGKVLSATVSLRTAVCPECGTVYTAGGTTTTKISYRDESNPYQQNKKSADAAMLIGRNLDLSALFCLSFGCTSKKEERLQEIDFTVVDYDEIPEELKTIIDQKKTGEFKLTYADQDELYIVVGYGKQLTGGYSIQFPDVYLTKENIVVTSVLLGPEGEEPANISYPYAVIKIEYRSEPVLFQ